MKSTASWLVLCADIVLTMQITDYLHPPSTSHSPIAAHDPPRLATATIRSLVELLQPYQLTKGETLMIINLRPLDLTLLDCIIEECDERFTSKQQEGILRIVGDVLGKEPRAVDVIGQDGQSDGHDAINGNEMEQ